jgi:hypothetical protein
MLCYSSSTCKLLLALCIMSGGQGIDPRKSLRFQRSVNPKELVLCSYRTEHSAYEYVVTSREAKKHTRVCV